jgi:hypothetical protein
MRLYSILLERRLIMVGWKQAGREHWKQRDDYGSFRVLLRLLHQPQSEKEFTLQRPQFRKDTLNSGLLFAQD